MPLLFANILLKITQYYHAHRYPTVSNCISNLTRYACTYQTFYDIYCSSLFGSFIDDSMPTRELI